MGAGRKSKYKTDIEYEKINGWRAGLYLRLSVEDENKDISNSIISQKELVEDFLSKNEDIEVFNYYIDDGYSGTNFERPSFKRMFEDMQTKKINTVIVKDLSRLGRNYLEVGNYIEQIFPLFNIRFISISDNIDSFLNPQSISNINLPLKNLMNEEYCRDISNKIKSAFDTMRRNGQYISGIAPYGYIKDPEDKHHLIIDEESAKVVKLIFNLCLSGLGTTNISKELNKRKIVNPSAYRKKLKNEEINEVDSLWTSSMVSKILYNQIYCGDMVQGKSKSVSYKVHKQVDIPEDEWSIVENTHEPIIDREIFEKVKQTRSKRKYNWNRNKTDASVFAGHLKCADCGKNMMKIIISSKKVSGETIKEYAYVCPTYSKKSKELCSRHYIKENDLRITISRSLKYHIDLLTDFEEILNKSKENIFEDRRIVSLINSIKKFETEQENLKKRKQQIYEDWKMDKINEEQYYEYTRDYIEEKENIESQIKQTKELITEMRQNNENATNNLWAEKLGQFKDIKVLTKNMLDELIDDIYVYEDRRLKINFKYRDEYKFAMNYIKQHK